MHLSYFFLIYASQNIPTTKRSAPTIFPNVTGIRLSIKKVFRFRVANCSCVKPLSVIIYGVLLNKPFVIMYIFATQCS